MLHVGLFEPTCHVRLGSDVARKRLGEASYNDLLALEDHDG
jgi:hypothetical protein